MKSNEIGLRSRVWPKRGFVENVEFASCAKRTRLKKRRGWDSNPRWSYPHSGFRDRPVQPLQHLSGRSGQSIILRDRKRFRFAILSRTKLRGESHETCTKVCRESGCSRK